MMQQGDPIQTASIPKTTRQPENIHISIVRTSEVSTVSISSIKVYKSSIELLFTTFPQRLRILPLGVLSQYEIGKRTNAWTKSSCSFDDALIPPFIINQTRKLTFYYLCADQRICHDENSLNQAKEGIQTESSSSRGDFSGKIGVILRLLIAKLFSTSC